MYMVSIFIALITCSARFIFSRPSFKSFIAFSYSVPLQAMQSQVLPISFQSSLPHSHFFIETSLIFVLVGFPMEPDVVKHSISWKRSISWITHIQRISSLSPPHNQKEELCKTNTITLRPNPYGIIRLKNLLAMPTFRHGPLVP